ncbi:SDR family NAD(P)-dependent oxidoreductase [Caenimonas sp. SL110]|uniref:SDR family NAD(P)-dependent oxidoreductase n=1 Tax=Caenimonas sp. SL110 TaxID=1450524 RepID=UPI00065362D8|nr:SDR family NAD(P)-dependent oxidoreductase [Caenimonas sp. SL110]
MLLKDKVCVIAGAGSPRGIGYATAQLFAEHGARVVMLDIAINDDIVAGLKAAVAATAGPEADVVGISCDISKLDDCKRAVDEIVTRHGAIDCLVNSAGIVRGTPMLSIEEDEYERILTVNLKGTFNLCQAVLPVLVARGCGSIVNLSSSAAQRGGGLVGGAHYAASKGGVIGLTRTIAREFGPKGIRANIVCPAMIETSMLDGLPENRLREIVAAVPLQRAGLPREAAGACLFLASELGGFVTGATIDVNGGSHIH